MAVLHVGLIDFATLVLHCAMVHAWPKDGSLVVMAWLVDQNAGLMDELNECLIAAWRAGLVLYVFQLIGAHPQPAEVVWCDQWLIAACDVWHVWLPDCPSDEPALYAFQSAVAHQLPAVVAWCD